MILSDYKTDSTKLSQLVLDIENKYPVSVQETPWSSFLDVEYQSGIQYDLNEFETIIIQICRNRWAEGIYDIPRTDIISEKIMMIHQDELNQNVKYFQIHDGSICDLYRSF